MSAPNYVHDDAHSDCDSVARVWRTLRVFKREQKRVFSAQCCDHTLYGQRFWGQTSRSQLRAKGHMEPAQGPSAVSLAPEPPKVETALLWCRRDLRVTDNPALHAALQLAKNVVRANCCNTLLRLITLENKRTTPTFRAWLSAVRALPRSCLKLCAESEILEGR